ncbi:MAG TPA: pentapeptide repeat-containing protein [Chitinophagales bacterium]|nr:pentapeptide repeat-containing protein [Chitinophagales bacterium]
MLKNVNPKVTIKLNASKWVKPKVEKLKLLKGIFSILKNKATHNWTSVPGDVIDSISAISFDAESGQIGWKLISRSVADALVVLILEANPDFTERDIETEDLDSQFSAALETEECFIDFDFFNKPGELPLITKSLPIFTEFLTLCDFTKIEATNMMIRFKAYFTYSLANEWQKNYKFYQALEDSLQTPFDAAARREYEWMLNADYLEKQINKPVFSESFSLKQIYVPLRAYYLRTPNQIETGTDNYIDRYNKIEKQKIAIDLEANLLEWVNKGDKKDAVRIIRGGPGCGKSSFLKVFATKLANSGVRVLFIPLHRFEIKDELDTAVVNFLKYDRVINDNPFSQEEKFVLIFDGLDELSMQGKALSEIAQSFLREVERKVTNYNDTQLRIQIIISGRDVVVQQNEDDFRRDGMILALLPYYLGQKEVSEFKDDSNILNVDQRDQWWNTYALLTGKSYQALPVELKKTEIDEITAQPLLNYLVALSYERGIIKFDDNTNLNQIYEDLLEAVHDRSYAGGTHKTVSRMKLEQFKRVLEEIAISSWHGNGRTTTVREIEKHIKDSGLESLLKDFVGDADKGVVSLLAAFYFRQAGQQLDGNQTFEFTHKSFGEYLTAKRVVDQVMSYTDQLILSEKTYNSKGWTIEACLISWIKLFGIKELDMDLIRFLKNEFSLRTRDELIGLQKTIVKFIDRVLLNGLPMEAVSPRASTFFIENQSSVFAEKALLVMHSLVAYETRVVSEFSWSNSFAFGEWLGRLRGQRIGSECFILRFLNHINIDMQILYINDLYGANLSYSSLRNTKMVLVCLVEADLVSVDLENAELTEANLKHANLTGANLTNAIMRDAILVRAILNNADLKRAHFTSANLEHAELKNTDLRMANLDYAYLGNSDLSFANLEGLGSQSTNFEGAAMEGVNLSGVNLNEANLAYSVLTDANLTGASLEYADLSFATMKSANMVGAFMHGAVLYNADLEGANLERTFLSDADLEGANLKNTILDKG